MPGSKLVAAVTDNKGFYNIALLPYWPSKTDYDKWAAETGFTDWWAAIDPREFGHGWFLEVFFPPVDRFETVFSNCQIPEGAAHMEESFSGQIREHVYWGSMRDRLAAAQTGELEGEKAAKREADPAGRVHVCGKKNLAVIRSGQDWFDTLPDERKLYVETMRPVLTAGMDFLRDRGNEVGCHSCRFMHVVDSTTRKVRT
ncbi:dehydratase [Hirsutella rhossiliensis]|uniref:Dehydratase domain-containing protein n=1 Tax=Hirsutella rhossiliensis TaxID=111463 RepID=A0A9P8SDK4_9HYPO|nr:dehydratase domain-containing protein [Hirsutella rhossiliensis]KAH0958054.1 dehydratase domain-containing protein [Hirsutella rhossiliensis]